MKKNENIDDLLELFCSLLAPQVFFGGFNKDALPIDDFAIGYVYGFGDGLLQASSVDNESFSRIEFFLKTFEQLFGGRERALQQLFKIQKSNENPKALHRAILLGGQEAQTFLNNYTSSEKDKKLFPMGLTKHFINLNEKNAQQGSA